MSEKKLLSFCYKGDRVYVHGTDIFNITLKYITELIKVDEYDSIDMTIRHVTKNNLDLFLENNLPSKQALPNVVFSLKSNAQNFRMVLVENNQPIVCNYSYLENTIIDAAIFNVNAKTIELKNFTYFTMIEKIVALNKALLNHLFPDVIGKWFFVKIKLLTVNWKLWEDDYAHILLSFKKNLEFKITDTCIYINNKLFGNIYFSLV